MHNILFIVDHLGNGGAERINIQLAEHLAERGHAISLMVLNGRKNSQHIPSCIDYIDLQLADEFAFGKMWRKKTLSPQQQHILHQHLMHIKPDLILTGYNNGHWLGNDLLNILYASGLTANVWHWIHGQLIEKRHSHHIFSALKEYIRRIRHTRAFIALFNSKNLIVVNQDLADQYQKLLPHAVIKTIANGVDETRLRQPLTQQQNEANPDKTWDVLFLGRLVEVKQADHALRAFAASGLTGWMALAGDGNQRATLEQLAQTLGIADRVDFLGWVDQPALLLTQSKIMVLSSRFEGSPIAILEALTLGVPVVAYNCCQGIASALPTRLHAQVLVKPQNVAELAEKMAQTVQQPYTLQPDERYQLSMARLADQIVDFVPPKATPMSIPHHD